MRALQGYITTQRVDAVVTRLSEVGDFGRLGVTAVTEWTEQNPVLEKVVFVCFQLENPSIYEGLLRG